VVGATKMLNWIWTGIRYTQECQWHNYYIMQTTFIMTFTIDCISWQSKAIDNFCPSIC